MCSPDIPAPPDPKETASASASTNIGTAVANAQLQNPNIVTPDYSTTTAQTGTYQWTDPYTGQTYDIPTSTQTTTLSPALQAAKDNSNAALVSASGAAANMASGLGPVDLLGGLPSGGSAANVYRPNYRSDAGLLTSFGGAGNVNNAIAGAGNIQTGVNNNTQAQSTFGSAGEVQRSIADAGQIQRQINNNGQAQSTFGDAGDITRTYGTDFSQDRRRVEDALRERMNPQLQQSRAALENRLVNQGLRPGSEAYNRAMDEALRQENDAQLGVILAGGQEQSRLANLEAQRAGFENAAQQQAYMQAMGRGEFANNAVAQNFAQDAARGQFANAAQQQQFGQNAAQGQFANSAQQQQFQELLARAGFGNQAQAQNFGQDVARMEAANAAQAQRFGQNAQQAQFGNSAQQQAYDQLLGRAQFGNAANQQAFTNANAAEAASRDSSMQDFGLAEQERGARLGELSSERGRSISELMTLLTGASPGQVNPAAPNIGGIPTTDVAGLINQNYDSRVNNAMAQYQHQQQTWGGVLGLLGSVASGAAAFSDRRVKKDIRKVGHINDLGLYEYRYKGEPRSAPKRIGVMAQEVQKKKPEAVIETPGGILAVNYGKIAEDA